MQLHTRRRAQREYYSLGARLSRLKQELASKQQELEFLQQQNGLLQTKREVLSTIADTFEFIHAHAEKDEGASSRPEEVELLQQLRAIMRQQASGEDGPRGPPWNNMNTGLARFKYVYIMPRYPGVADMTVDSYLAAYGAAVRDVALNLVLHRVEQRQVSNSGDAGRMTNPEEDDQPLSAAGLECDATHVNEPPIIERLGDSLLRLFNLYVSAAAAGRSDLNVAGMVTNCDNPQVKLQEAPYQRYLRVVSLMELTEQQRRELLDAAKVFQALIASIQQEMQRICSVSSSSSGNSSTATCAAGDCIPSSGNEQLANLFGTSTKQHKAYRMQRSLEEQANARMRVLLLKYSTIWRVLYGYVYSKLTLVQLADLLCLVHPFMPAIDLFLKALAEYHAQQEGKKE